MEVWPDPKLQYQKSMIQCFYSIEHSGFSSDLGMAQAIPGHHGPPPMIGCVSVPVPS
jgi:hypothetical protein